MTRFFGDDLSSRVLAASRDGMPARSAAAKLELAFQLRSPGWPVYGHLLSRPDGGLRLDAHEDFIVCMIEEEKDVTLIERVLRLAAERAVSIGRSAPDVWLQKRGWTFKKRRHMYWSRNARTS